MNKKADMIGILALFIAALTLLFGDNLYEQMTGHPVFATKNVPTQINIVGATDDLTNKLSAPSQTITPNPIPARTFTPTEINVIVPSATTKPRTILTIFPTSSIAGTYTLQLGEFPYCIARRFDVDPDQLLSINGLESGTEFRYPVTLKIPPSGSFPGTRALRQHPTLYTVQPDDLSIYWIACRFGDVFPEDIAELNGLSVNSSLNTGQVLNIP